MELIHWYHNDLLASDFRIEKTRKLIAQKYYWYTLEYDVEIYVKGCDIYLALKIVRDKLYNKLQLFSTPTYWSKDLFMNLLTRLLVSLDWRDESYDSILIIIYQLTKLVHFKLVKITIDAPSLAEVIINMIV